MRNDVPDGDSGDLVPLAGVERAGGATGKVLIEQLRASIRALEQVPVSLAIPPAPGAALPRSACSKSPPERLLSKLSQGGLHEIKPETYRDHPAALGFALSLIAREAAQAQGLVLWCLTKETAREWGRPYGPALLEIGIDPSRLLMVEVRTEEDAAWALEDGLKSGALLASLAQIHVKTPLAARRLGLAAQASRTPCLLLSGHGGADLSGLPGTLTRWRVAATKSSPAPFDGSAPGAAAFRLTLERCRGEAPGRSFRVEFSHESDRLRVAAASCDRAAEAGERGEQWQEQIGHVRTG